MAEYTETDLNTVRSRRIRGERTVQFGDRTTTYYSDAESRQVENDIRRELAATSGRKRQFQVVASKGL